ncbi:unnamed protein product [Nezara viridula]|uniref:Uncharacterized protein n=1 Tax=Nezara viridula TaxID=85310 RepID=A0A9P0E1J6_NEZVI|nr:unnamed protein product [Nezara viridula]
MVHLNDKDQSGDDVDDSWLSSDDSSEDEGSREGSPHSSSTSVSSLSEFTPSPPSSPVTISFLKRSQPPPPFRAKRMRLLPPRTESAGVSGPFIVRLLPEEEINEDLKIIRESLKNLKPSPSNGKK